MTLTPAGENNTLEVSKLGARAELKQRLGYPAYEASRVGLCPGVEKFCEEFADARVVLLELRLGFTFIGNISHGSISHGLTQVLKPTHHCWDRRFGDSAGTQ